MSRAHNARKKARKADPIGYRVRSLETRVSDIQHRLEAQGVPTKDAIAAAVDAVKAREQARHA